MLGNSLLCSRSEQVLSLGNSIKLFKSYLKYLSSVLTHSLLLEMLDLFKFNFRRIVVYLFSLPFQDMHIILIPSSCVTKLLLSTISWSPFTLLALIALSLRISPTWLTNFHRWTRWVIYLKLTRHLQLFSLTQTVELSKQWTSRWKRDVECCSIDLQARHIDNGRNWIV